jgi:hypothetical protein
VGWGVPGMAGGWQEEESSGCIIISIISSSSSSARAMRTVSPLPLLSPSLLVCPPSL